MSLLAQVISYVFCIGAILLIVAPFLLYAILGTKSWGARILYFSIVLCILGALVIEPLYSRIIDSRQEQYAASLYSEEPKYKYIDGKWFDLSDKAWYTTYGKSFHTDRNCGQLTKSSDIEPTSTIGEAIKAGKGDPCDYCAFDD